MTSPAQNQLFYGDNLEVLQQHIDAESVDLVYLDPPFKSNADYNVLFSERDGTQAAAQVEAFEDTWTWDLHAAESFDQCVQAGGRVADALATLLVASLVIPILAEQLLLKRRRHG